MLKINRDTCTNPSLISSHLVDFFRNLFNGISLASNEDFSIIPQVIIKMIDVKDNSFLIGLPSRDEINATVFGMKSYSAPRPDSLLNNLNSNFFILIMKSDSTVSPDKFIPIVLGNFVFKVITKILAN